MRDFSLSSSNGERLQAIAHGHQLMADIPHGPTHGPLVLAGSQADDLAAAAMWALSEGYSIVLEPDGITSSVAGTCVLFDGASPTVTRGSDDPPPWQVAMYTSGSTGSPRAYGFTAEQLGQLARWYTAIYGVTDASAIVTHLPTTYNFAFVAGVYLAGSVGAQLHLASSPADVFESVAHLARNHDRCVVLANPVLLARPPGRPLGATVLIDSGGAPLSTRAIIHYRSNVADLREGYGLTETGSLTHFDGAGSPTSLGTVGTALPGVSALTVDIDGKPRVHLTTPALGTPIGGLAHRTELLTEDVGHIDEVGRLRLLGRSDDHCINGFWPRDTLDAIGSALGTEPALVRHPTPGNVRLRFRSRLNSHLVHLIQALIAEQLSLSRAAVLVDAGPSGLLHSHKIARHAHKQDARSR